MRKSRYSTMGLLVGVVVGLLLGCQAARGDFVFGEPVRVPNVNSSSVDGGPSISADGLELYFVSNRDHGADLCYDDIWVATRATTDDEWGEAVNLGPPINTAGPEVSLSISADGLELYFAEGGPQTSTRCAWPRPGGYGNGDLWVSTRATRDGDWGTPVNLGPEVNSTSYDGGPAISSDGLSLFFSSQRPGGHGGTDLYVTTRPTRDDPWDPPVNLGAAVNTSTFEVGPEVSPDGLWLFFTVHPYLMDGNVFVSRRVKPTDPWGLPEPLASINTSDTEYSLIFSSGSSTLYFSRVEDFNSWRSPLLATWDLWQVEVAPVVDLNGDGIVDAADMSIIVDNWHTENTLCDIAPAPLGDGFVDVQDLTVLAEHLFEDYRLIAHWELDETEGSAAHDSVGDNDGTLHGRPLWKPTGGEVGGALEFDGTDDYVSIPFILNPAETSFSVSAWIKGGAPGQVIVSQKDALDGYTTNPGNAWLLTDASYGRLMTRLMHPPFDPLMSESVITNGQWHHVGLVYDLIGLHRYLYVDGTEVAKDTGFVGGVGSDGGLHIGSSKTLDAGSFWSGLVDDVRLYNQALSAEDIEAASRFALD